MEHKTGQETERVSRHGQVELTEGELDVVVGGNSDPDDPDPLK